VWWWEVGNESIWERYVGECENRHLNIIVARWSFLLEARVYVVINQAFYEQQKQSTVYTYEELCGNQS
jgi:hypothetical protein